MKHLLILLTFFLAGCAGDPPVENQPVEVPPTEVPPENPPVENPTAENPSVYTREPHAVYAITGRVWELEGIYNLLTNEMTTIDTGNDGEHYSIVFDTDSTAKGKVINSEIEVKLSAPFFTFYGEDEATEDAKLFTKIASTISGCEYIERDGLLKFYSEENNTCLVYKCTGVMGMKGRIVYFEDANKWGIRPVGNIVGIILYDFDDTFFPVEDIPDNFKTQGARVEISGNNAVKMEYLEVGNDLYMGAIGIFYHITLTDLKLIEQ
ncbi:MAG: hypothetical protein LBJ39_01320 [Tannerellaceae bacterium]|jgi:hypothetical protein|nr:hypothetical protein [Tannerellaceae bacterium]